MNLHVHLEFYLSKLFKYNNRYVGTYYNRLYNNE